MFLFMKNYHNDFIKDYLESYLKNKHPDVILHSEDGTEFKTHKVLLGQTKFMRKLLKSSNCCGIIEIICPCFQGRIGPPSFWVCESWKNPLQWKTRHIENPRKSQQGVWISGARGTLCHLFWPALYIEFFEEAYFQGKFQAVQSYVSTYVYFNDS